MVRCITQRQINYEGRCLQCSVKGPVYASLLVSWWGNGKPDENKDRLIEPEDVFIV
jgi:hypothetical protein